MRPKDSGGIADMSSLLRREVIRVLCFLATTAPTVRDRHDLKGSPLHPATCSGSCASLALGDFGAG